MAACDACISLRSPTMGETSGSAIRALSLGRPLVVSDLGWFSELPDDVALKVPVDEDEIPALATALELLASSEPTQLAMSDAARAYAQREHDLGRVAESYAAALEEAAGWYQGRGRSRRRGRAGRRRDRHRAGYAFAAELAGRLDDVGLARNGRPEPEPPPKPQPACACARLGLARRARRPLLGLPLRVVTPCRRTVDHGRRAHLLRACEELRANGPLPHPRRASRCVRRRVSAADRAGLACVRLRTGRVRRREGDRLGADVADRDPGVLPCAQGPEADSLSARRPARRRRAVADVHGHADDGDRLLSALRLRGTCARARVRAPDDPATARAARSLRARVPDTLAGDRAHPGRRDGAATPGVARPPASTHARRLSRALRSPRRRRRRRACRPACAWSLPVRRARQLQRDRPCDLPARPGAEVAVLPRRRARPLPRHRARLRRSCFSPSSAGRSTVHCASFSQRHCR